MQQYSADLNQKIQNCTPKVAKALKRRKKHLKGAKNTLKIPKSTVVTKLHKYFPPYIYGIKFDSYSDIDNFADRLA